MKPGGKFRSAGLLFLCFALFGLFLPLAAQQSANNDNAFAVRTLSLPKALVHSRFQYQLKATAGTVPYHWRLASGALPEGLQLSSQGRLDGSPTETGEFHFKVTVTDASHPSLDRSQALTLKVSAPLFARWEQYPRVDGQKIDGTVKVSNDTDHDFDLTFIAVAVNANGRAEALGYQRFALKKNTEDFEIPLGENVPFGSYKIYVDVVGEVAATNSIYRAHLETKARLMLQQVP